MAMQDNVTELPEEGTTIESNTSQLDVTSRVVSGEMKAIQTALAVLLSVVTIFGNSAVLVPIFRPKYRQSLLTTTNILIGNLGLDDLLLGLVSSPPHAFPVYRIYVNLYGCLIIYMTLFAMSLVTIVINAGIALERLISIRYPFHKEQMLTLRRVALAAGFAWVGCFVTAFSPLVTGWHQQADVANRPGYFCGHFLVMSQRFTAVAMGVIHIPAVLIILFSYANIFMVARRHARQIRDLTLDTSPEVESRFKADLVLTWKCLVVVLVYSITRLPIALLNLYENITGTACPQCTWGLVWLQRINSAINPILYANSSLDLKTAVLEQFRCSSSPRVTANE